MARCSACGALYTSPRPAQRSFDAGYPFYQRSRQVLGGTAVLDLAQARRPFLARARRLEEIAGRPGRLLDVGCGDGVFCHLMRRRGWETTGVDREPLVVFHARDVLGLDCRILDVERQDLPEGPFDAVTLWGVLQLSRRPRQLLERVRERLAPRGVLAIGVSNAAGAGASLFGSAWRGWGLPRHLVHFTADTLSWLARAAGFEVAALAFQTPPWMVEGSLQATGPGERAGLRRRVTRLARGPRSDTMELYARAQRRLHPASGPF